MPKLPRTDRRASLIPKLESEPPPVQSTVGGGLLVAVDGEVVAAKREHLVEKPTVKFFIRFCAIASLVSVCMNTPKTFDRIEEHFFPDLKPPEPEESRCSRSGSPLFCLREILLLIDLFITIVLTLEALLKIRMRGLYRGERSYLRKNWCLFDLVMIIFNYLSIIIHVSNFSIVLDSNVIYLILIV